MPKDRLPELVKFLPLGLRNQGQILKGVLIECRLNVSTNDETPRLLDYYYNVSIIFFPLNIFRCTIDMLDINPLYHLYVRALTMCYHHNYKNSLI